MAVHRTFNSLARAIEDYADEVEEGVVAVQKKVAFAAGDKVIDDTPVDTGRAISNWILSIGNPVAFSVQPHVPGRSGSTVDANKREAKQRMRLEAAPHRDPRRPLVISNNLDYIEDLNNGFSSQAPAGFVEAAVTAGTLSLRGARIFRRRS